MEVGPRDGYAMEFRAQLDRMKFPARGRKGGANGGPTVVQLSDGTRYPAKARFPVPEGQTVQLAFPGGGGMGEPSHRDLQAVARDVLAGAPFPWGSVAVLVVWAVVAPLAAARWFRWEE